LGELTVKKPTGPSVQETPTVQMVPGKPYQPNNLLGIYKQNLYYELGSDGKPVSNTVYTSPSKTETVQVQSAGITKLGQPQRQYAPGQPIYQNIDTLKITSGPQPLRLPDKVPSVGGIGRENYNSVLGLYSRPSDTAGKQTPYLRQPTTQEQTAMLKAYESGQLPVEQPIESTTFFRGGQEVTIKSNYKTSPTYSSGEGTMTYQPNVVFSAIKPDQTVGVERRIEETILRGRQLAGGTYLTNYDEPIYLRTYYDRQNLQAILNDTSGSGGGGAKKLREFLRIQQAKLKMDMSRFNELTDKQLTIGLSPSEQTEYFNLEKRINNGQVGTLRQVMIKATDEQGGRTSGLWLEGLRNAYQSEKGVLKYQIAGAAVGGVAGLVPGVGSVVSGISKVLKPITSKTATISFSGLVAGGAAMGEYAQTKDTGYAIAAGVGAGSGFLLGMYSKPIVEGSVKLSKATVQTAKKIFMEFDKRFATLPEGPTKYGMGVGSTMSKSEYDQEMIYRYVQEYADKNGMSYDEAYSQLIIKSGLNGIKKAVISGRDNYDPKSVIDKLKETIQQIKDNPNFSEEDRAGLIESGQN
jgi:hypothetical protein